MTGPPTAVSGEEITYLVKYSLTDPDTLSGTDIVIKIPQNTTFVSSEVVSGPAGTFVGETAGLVRWGFRGSAEETEGAVALTVRIDDTFVGPIYGWCYIPGTLTFNPESRGSMETQVFAPGTLPEAGGGAPAAAGTPLVASDSSGPNYSAVAGAIAAATAGAGTLGGVAGYVRRRWSRR